MVEAPNQPVLGYGKDLGAKLVLLGWGVCFVEWTLVKLTLFTFQDEGNKPCVRLAVS